MQRKLFTMLMLSAATTCALTASTRSQQPIEHSPHIESLEEHTKACEKEMREAIERDVHAYNDRATALAKEAAVLESRKEEHQMRMMGAIAEHADYLVEVAARKKERAETQLEQTLTEFQELQTRRSAEQAQAEREIKEIKQSMQNNMQNCDARVTEIREKKERFNTELSNLTKAQKSTETAKNNADQRVQEAKTALGESTLEDNTELEEALDYAQKNSSEIASKLKSIEGEAANLKDALDKLEDEAQYILGEYNNTKEFQEDALAKAINNKKETAQLWTEHYNKVRDALITLKDDREATIGALKNAREAAATAQETLESARKKEEAKRQAEQDAEEAKLQKIFWETLGAAPQEAAPQDRDSEEDQLDSSDHQDTDSEEDQLDSAAPQEAKATKPKDNSYEAKKARAIARGF